MPSRALPETESGWCCLRCSQPLEENAGGFLCQGCGQQYPIFQGVAILTRDPLGYVRSELASLDRARNGAIQHRRWIEEERSTSGLTEASLRRHADVLDTEIGRRQAFLALLQPTRDLLASMPDEQRQSAGRGSGWGFDALFPYLLRDWTGTQEMRSAAATMRAAIERACPDSGEKIIAFAGCGAAGVLDEIGLNFHRVVAFDLTFPVLAAARYLLDGNELKVPMPRAVNASGSLVLRRRNGAGNSSRVHLAVMDAFETAFADDSVDCIVTSFLLDLLPDPIKLAKEIHRVLHPDGVWINYGPSGPLHSLWRFDEAEGRAFFEATGFNVLDCTAVRSTYLDLSRDCPSWSFQNHVCYLTLARKTPHGFSAAASSMPIVGDLLDAVPEHNRGALLVRRQRLNGERSSRVLLQYERFPGRNETFEITSDAACILELVDGRRSVREIARLAEGFAPPTAPDDTVRVVATYLEQKVLKIRPS